jgi:hypothetical protein
VYRGIVGYVGKAVEISDCGLNVAVSCHLPGGNEENRDILQRICTAIELKFEFYASQIQIQSGTATSTCSRMPISSGYLLLKP